MAVEKPVNTTSTGFVPALKTRQTIPPAPALSGGEERSVSPIAVEGRAASAISQRRKRGLAMTFSSLVAFVALDATLGQEKRPTGRRLAFEGLRKSKRRAMTRLGRQPAGRPWHFRGSAPRHAELTDVRGLAWGWQGPPGRQIARIKDAGSTGHRNAAANIAAGVL